MAATLRLDKFSLMYLIEGAVGNSQLRWDIYPKMVNDVWPQLTESEREFIFTYVKRDDSWYFNTEMQHVDETAKEYYLQMLARYNPANQWVVTMRKGREKKTNSRQRILVERQVLCWMAAILRTRIHYQA
jgi:carboxylesterase type B